MTRQHTVRSWWPAALSNAVWAICLLWAAPAPAAAQSVGGRDPGDLYQANAIVTGTDMRQRPWGFAQCLREVLVKLSGEPRLKDDPRVADLATHADQFVAAFDYVDPKDGIPHKDDQASYDRPQILTVHFDPGRIDAALVQLGQTPWRGTRPVVVPVLLVRGPKPPAYLLSAETPRGVEQRQSFAEAASELGMTTRFPTAAELAAWGASPDPVAVPDKPPPASAGEAIVVGSLDWNETLPGWVGTWRARWDGADHIWRISGVNYDAAFRDIVRGIVLLASGHGTPD